MRGTPLLCRLKARTAIVPSSPNVKMVTKESGFMPERYALRYGTYMVPHMRPAPSAAMTPEMARAADVADPVCTEAAESMTALTTMAMAPPRTLAQLLALAPFSSWKKNQPQNRPTRVLVFQRGKAMERPTSRMAKTVNVLATAQRAPARTAQTMRWGRLRRSRKT